MKLHCSKNSIEVLQSPWIIVTLLDFPILGENIQQNTENYISHALLLELIKINAKEPFCPHNINKDARLT